MLDTTAIEQLTDVSKLFKHSNINGSEAILGIGLK